MHVINWQSVLSEHQGWTLRAFAALPGVELAIVSARDQLAERQAQGWIRPELSGLDVTPLPVHGWFAFGRRLIRANPGAHHLFCGLWADRRLFCLLLYAWWSGCKLALLTEPYSDSAHGLLRDQGIVLGRAKVIMRKTLYRIAGLLLGRRISPLFAISHKAAIQFVRAGFRPQAICPFGYFVPRLPDIDAAQPARNDPPLRLVFIASLIRRKGLDILLQALALLPADEIAVSLDIFGPGNAGVLPRDNPRVRYRGVIAFGETQRVIANYDALVVPSRFDGWSVVVNEALLQGVPVLASTATGAADMVQKQHAGFAFDPAAPEDLAKLIRRIAADRTLLDTARERALAFRDRLAPELAARYMFDCFDSISRGVARPACPWY